MPVELSWKTDPVVQLEAAILPVLSLAPDILCRLAMAADHPPDVAQLLDALSVFDTAEKQLREGGAQFLEPTGISLDAEAMGICRDAADILAQAQRELSGAITSYSNHKTNLNGSGARMADLISRDLRSSVNAAIDAFRRVFIGTVLKRHAAQARQAQTAVTQLAEISETIFFIGINASVEAARVGEAGLGFSVISEDIRYLAANARSSTASLRAVLDGSA